MYPLLHSTGRAAIFNPCLKLGLSQSLGSIPLNATLTLPTPLLYHQVRGSVGATGFHSEGKEAHRVPQFYKRSRTTFFNKVCPFSSAQSFLQGHLRFSWINLRMMNWVESPQTTCYRSVFGGEEESKCQCLIKTHKGKIKFHSLMMPFIVMDTKGRNHTNENALRKLTLWKSKLVECLHHSPVILNMCDSDLDWSREYMAHNLSLDLNI